MSLLGAAILGYIGYKIFVEDKSINTSSNASQQTTSTTQQTTQSNVYQSSSSQARQTVNRTVDYRQNFQGPIYSSVAGITFNGRQYYAAKCYSGQQLRLVRDQFNVHDHNAIEVYAGSNQIGFIKKELAASLAPVMDAGKELEAVVEQVTGGGSYNYGVNIKIVEKGVKATSNNVQSTNTWKLEYCKMQEQLSYQFNMEDYESLPYEEAMKKIAKELEEYGEQEKARRPYVKDTRKFYHSSYVCPRCGEHTYKTVFPIGREYPVKTTDGNKPLKRVFTCDGCKKFFAPVPGEKLSVGRIYTIELGVTDYKKYLKEMDFRGTREGRSDL